MARARAVAGVWRDPSPSSLVVGLEGELGAGKTTWVRGMLEGLGHVGRVPSPTYTLLEPYEFGELSVAHLDLYRLAGGEQGGLEDARELDALGVRDWLARDPAWLLVEWPSRSQHLNSQCDMLITLDFLPGDGRSVSLSAQSDRGRASLKRLGSSTLLDSSFGS